MFCWHNLEAVHVATPNNHHGWILILKLRHNIELESDLQLAELEINRLLGYPEPLDRSALNAWIANGTLQSVDLQYCRSNGVVAYKVQVERLNLRHLFRKLSFAELVIGIKLLPLKYRDEIVQELKNVPRAFMRYQISGDKVYFRLIPFNTAAEWSDVIAKRATSPNEAVKALERTLTLVLEGNLPNHFDMLPERALSAKLTTGHLFHGLHVYKAKFFPRMVRALLNAYAPHLDAYVLDPYAGSGTALTEASIMGMPSAGIDIDPLSVLIANAKIRLVRELNKKALENICILQDQLDTLRTGQLTLFEIRERQAAYASLIPPFLLRRIPPQVQDEIVRDISFVLSVIGCLDQETTLPFRVLLSDAISRKLKFRFLGLGYGRFALNIMPGRIMETFRDSLGYLAKSITVWHWLQHAANLTLAPSEVRLGDARLLPFDKEAFDFIVTSPPYLPASSGRENYLKSKALAMIALGLIRADEVDTYERTQTGSVHREHNDWSKLPSKAREVVEWMAADDVRRVKAVATASYFVDLDQSLREIRRVLRPGGRCAMVIAKQHTFYRYKSREVVRIIDNAEIVSELATLCGLELENAIHVELRKQNTVARPRSLDAYYETILILRRL